MSERKMDWCDYEVRISHHEIGSFYIVENGTWQGSGSASVLSRGVHFEARGNDAKLWLIRDQKSELLASRISGKLTDLNHILGTDSLVEIFIPAQTEWIKEGDGFVISKDSRTPEAAPIDLVEGFPRPTIYL